MKNNQNIPQFTDVLEEVNFILYGSTSGKPLEQHDSEREKQAEVAVR